MGKYIRKTCDCCREPKEGNAGLLCRNCSHILDCCTDFGWAGLLKGGPAPARVLLQKLIDWEIKREEEIRLEEEANPALRNCERWEIKNGKRVPLD
jgi:hypothetical protein